MKYWLTFNEINCAQVKLMDTKPEITKCAPDLGQDNKEIYEGVLGLSDADLAKLKEEKVI